MGYFLEPEAITNFRDIPVGLFEQNLGFLNKPTANEFGGGFTRMLFQDLIEVINVYG